MINKARWERFKKNRRGYISLWLFVTLFTLSIFAEFIANDKPLFIKHRDSLYFPVLFSYSETVFGGDFQTEADYSDEYIISLINESGYIISAPIKYSYDTIDTKLQTPSPSPPSKNHLLGTDANARDVLARVIYGFRISIIFGFLLTVLSSIIGILVGAMQGYYGGKIDLIGQRAIEVYSALPSLYILIILSNFIQMGFWILLFVMLLFSWTALVGVVRAEFLRVRNFDYVKAAKILGQSDFNIILKHILPNATIATITFMPFILSSSIVTLTSLDFLGLGMPIGSASLGELLAQSKANLHASWLGITSFLVLSILLSLLVFIGEAFRDAFDPRGEVC